MGNKSSKQAVKIGNREGRKWKLIHSDGKTGIELGSPDDVGDEFYLERDKFKRSWSFFMTSGKDTQQQDRLYVAYDKAASTLTLKTLEDINSSMDRHFILLLQPSGRLLMQPQSSSKSYIGVQNDHLIIVGAEEVTEESHFVIGVEVSRGDRQGDLTVEIRMEDSTKWMISTGAEAGDKVMVGVTGTDSVWEYKAESPLLIKVPGKDLYISKDCDNCNEIVFGSSTKSNSQFQKIGGNEKMGIKLQQKNQYVATGGERNSEFLSLVDANRLATRWKIIVKKRHL